MPLEVHVKVEPLEPDVSPANVWKDAVVPSDLNNPEAAKCAQMIKQAVGALFVKEEPSQSAVTEAALTGLYFDHVVKEECVLGPEQVLAVSERHLIVLGANQAIIEKRDLLFALRDCSVRLERIPHRQPLLSNTSTADQSHASNTGATGDRHTRDSWTTGNRHTSDTHTNETIIYMCDFCDKTFKHKNKLIKHIQIHMCEGKNYSYVKNIRQHICEVCGELFKQISHLLRHIRTHKGEKYACNVCKKEYTRLNNLRDHNCGRKGQKPYSCEICNKRFSRKMVLKTHQRIHTGEKPYVCEICNKKFTSSTNIQRHMLTHSGEMPYSCEICKKKFTRLTNLNEHILVHSGKKYRCAFCNRQLSRLRTLKLHEKKCQN